MPDKINYPALSRQVTEMVLSGATEHAEEAFSDTAEQFGDLAVSEVLEAMPPEVASMHLADFAQSLGSESGLFPGGMEYRADRR